MISCFLNILLLIIIIAILSSVKEGYRYEDKYKPGAYIPRAEENGFVRPLWGKLMPVKEEIDRHATFGKLPKCEPPYKKELHCMENVEVPYSYNKL